MVNNSSRKLIGLLGAACAGLCALAALVSAIGLGAFGAATGAVEMGVLAGGAAIVGLVAWRRRRSAAKACATDRRCGC